MRVQPQISRSAVCSPDITTAQNVTTTNDNKRRAGETVPFCKTSAAEAVSSIYMIAAVNRCATQMRGVPPTLRNPHLYKNVKVGRPSRQRWGHRLMGLILSPHPTFGACKTQQAASLPVCGKDGVSGEALHTSVVG